MKGTLTMVPTGADTLVQHELEADERPLMSATMEEEPGGGWVVTVTMWDGQPRPIGTWSHASDAYQALTVAVAVLGLIP